MSENKQTEAIKMTNTKKSEAQVSKKLQLTLLTAMCAMLFIVCFMAFLRIENNLHAFLILITGTITDVIIFFSGINPSNQ